MNQERYWRNLIADEIKAEHDKVKTYYQKRGMNKGGMSNEEHTRLNIFLLAESIARTMKNSQDSPREEIITTPPPTPHKVQSDEINNFVEKQIADFNEIPGQQTIEDVTAIEDAIAIEDVQIIQDSNDLIDPVRNLVKDTPYQNEFGEIL